MINKGTMKKFYALSLLIIILTSSIVGQTELLTTAEKTEYTSTSTYMDVMSFVSKLLKTSPYIRLDTMATSIEGKIVPLLIIGDPLPLSPTDLKNDNRMVVYIQANIHAGEVEGKEATQMLARDLLKDPHPQLFKNIVLLVCPIFNPDGNDKISKKNRTNQNGPANGVGVRYNGEFLDLNRDAMKLETPEVRGLVTNVLNKWDPALSVDCHTTDGSFHQEPVTFVWMMNPNGDHTLINYMRDEFCPQTSKVLLSKFNVENIFYGEFIDRMNLEKGWISYASEPRYIVNYIGVRNRFSILNENYVYADFKTRVNGCYHLLLSILQMAAEHKDEMKQLLTEADKKSIMRNELTSEDDSLAIKYQGYPTLKPITIKAYEADSIPGAKGYWRFKKSDRERTVTVPYIADYYATKSIKIPYAYILDVPDSMVLEVLKLHGIHVEKLTEPATLNVQEFRISDLKPSERLNQGHYTETTDGEFVQEAKNFTPVLLSSIQLKNWVILPLTCWNPKPMMAYCFGISLINIWFHNGELDIMISLFTC